LQVIHSNIEDNQQNYTRFFVLTKQKQILDSTNKTSIILQTPADTKPGALYRALAVLHNYKLNLTMLHSRPIIGAAWHYYFYLDIQAGLQEQALQNAIQELKDQDCEITILGSYVNGMQNLAKQA